MKIKTFTLKPVITHLLLIAIALNLTSASRLPATFQPAERIAPAKQLGQTPSGDQTFYLPLVFKNYPRQATIFGVEISGSISPKMVDKIGDGGMYWTRNYAFSWEQIQPLAGTPPSYHWESVNEAGLREAHLRHLQVIATVKYTPAWAQKVPGHSCGPVSPAALSQFAQFMKDLVTRYAYADYQVKYWEIGNEPDVDPSLVAPDNLYGCWGDKNDAYYGGGYYAQMLKQVYPAIKAADPEAKVLIGGLLLDCDPTHPPAGKDCKPAKFFEGILRGGGSPYFDIVNYHGYAYYSNGAIVDETNSAWSKRGGVTTGKANFLRSVMASYGINKPIVNSESSLLCTDSINCPDGGTPSAAFLNTQADYIVNVFVRTWAANLYANIWYQIEGPGWREVGLLDDAQQPRPAYNAYQFMTVELAGATYVRLVTQFTSVKGYEFSERGKRVWVLWSADNAAHAITLPTGVTKVYDKFGSSITPVGGKITVKSPLYVELTP